MQKIVVSEEGMDFTIGVFAGIMTKSRRRRIVLVRARNSNNWSLPGGRVEWQDVLSCWQYLRSFSDLNLIFRQALRREVLEELGIELPSFSSQKAGVFCSKNPKTRDIALVFPFVLSNSQILFLYQAIEQPPPPDSEIEERNLFSLEDVKNLELPGPRMKRMIRFCFCSL